MTMYGPVCFATGLEAKGDERRSKGTAEPPLYTRRISLGLSAIEID